MPEPKKQPVADPYASLPDTSSQVQQDPYVNLPDAFAAPKDNKEGLYRMKSPDGADVKVPYSKVMLASKSGYKIHPDDRTTYADDWVEEMRKKAIADVRSKHKGFIPGLEFVSKFAIQHAMNPDTDLPQAYTLSLPLPKMPSSDAAWKTTEESEHERLLTPAKLPTKEQLTHKALDQIPTVGGIAGGAGASTLAAGSGPGVIPARMAGAGFGGGVGEKVRQEAEAALFPYEHRPTAEENNRRIKIEAGMMAGAEGLGLASEKLLAPAQKYFADTAMASEKAGFRMLPSEASRKAPSFLEKLAKGHVFSSKSMQMFRDAQNAETQTAVKQLADSISNFSGSSEDLGNMVKAGIKRHTEEFRTLQNQLYGDIDTAVGEHVVQAQVQTQVPSKILDASGKPIMRTVTKTVNQTVDNLMPSRAKIVEFAEKELKKIQAGKAAAGKAPEGRYETILKGIVNNRAATSTYQGMAQARSEWLALARDMNSGLSDPEAGFVKKMAGLADESMMDAAQKSGIQGLPEQIRAANKLTADEHTMFEQELVKKVVETKRPEAIATLVRGKNIGNEELRNLFTIMPKELHAPVQRQILLDTMRQSTNMQSKIFNERRFAETIGNIGDDRGQIIFGNNWGNIKQLTSLLERVNGPTRLGGGTGAALQNNSAVKGLIYLAYGAPLDMIVRGEVKEGVVTTLSQLAFMKGLSNILTRPELTVKLINILQTTARVAPYASAGIVNSGRGEKIGKGETPDEKNLREVMKRAEELKNKVTPSTGPQSSIPSNPKDMMARANELQDMFHSSGFSSQPSQPSPPEGTGPQSSLKPTHRYDETTQTIVTMV